MNTPKFQMRKMQRQMIKERDYRDGLERELASKLTLIAQRGITLKCLDNITLELDETQNYMYFYFAVCFTLCIILCLFFSPLLQIKLYFILCFFQRLVLISYSTAWIS